MEQDDTNFGLEASGTTHCERYLGFIVLGIEFEHVPTSHRSYVFYFGFISLRYLHYKQNCPLCVVLVSFFCFVLPFWGLAPGFGR
jgi:hypothetical protein